MPKRVPKGELTQERLKEVLWYDPQSGIFTWRKKYCDKVILGAPAGGLDPNGYRIIVIDGKNHRAHRLAFLYMAGFMPKEVDHKDGFPDHNNWENLRAADRYQNGKNLPLRKDNKTGKKGVRWRADIQKYAVQITSNKKVYSLGCFDGLEQAAAAYDRAAVKYHGEFARLNTEIS